MSDPTKEELGKVSFTIEEIIIVLKFITDTSHLAEVYRFQACLEFCAEMKLRDAANRPSLPEAAAEAIRSQSGEERKA